MRPLSCHNSVSKEICMVTHEKTWTSNEEEKPKPESKDTCGLGSQWVPRKEQCSMTTGWPV